MGEATISGFGGAGAHLTPTGREVVALYRAMQNHAETTVVPRMERFRNLMVQQPPPDWRAPGINKIPYWA